MPTIVKVDSKKRELQKQIDRLGVIREEKKKLEAEEKTVLEFLKEHVNTEDSFKPEDSRSFGGKEFDMSVSAKSLERKVDMAEAFKILGKGPFLQIAKISLTDADKYLTPDQRKIAIKETRTGSRSFKVTRQGA